MAGQTTGQVLVGDVFGLAVQHESGPVLAGKSGLVAERASPGLRWSALPAYALQGYQSCPRMRCRLSLLRCRRRVVSKLPGMSSIGDATTQMQVGPNLEGI